MTALAVLTEDPMLLAVEVLDGNDNLRDALWDACAADPATYSYSLVRAIELRRGKSSTPDVGNPPTSALRHRLIVPGGASERHGGAGRDDRRSGRVASSQSWEFVRRSPPEPTHVPSPRWPTGASSESAIFVRRPAHSGDVGRGGAPLTRPCRFRDIVLMAVSVPVGTVAVVLAVLTLVDAIRTVAGQ